MTMDSAPSNSAPPSNQPAAASNTDPEFWMKRLNDMKKGVDIPTSHHPHAEERRTMHAPTTFSSTLLKPTEDSNRIAQQSSPSFKEQVSMDSTLCCETWNNFYFLVFLQLSTMSEHGARMEFLQKKLAQLQMAKLNRN